MGEGKQNEFTRREFLKTSGAAMALAGIGLSVPVTGAAQENAKPAAASDKIIIGCIGLGGRGMGDMQWFMKNPDVEIGAVCDIYEPRLQAAVEKTGGKAKAYTDFRKLLEQKDLDAVIITAPPQWHPLMSIYACQAGKDVYCEKPICNYPAEAQAMLNAARANRRVTQVGTQIHAGDNYRRAVEIVRSGILGKIGAVRVICNMNEYPGGVGRPADSAPPQGLDWDMWLGPAPKRPFNQARFDTHRYFKDYVGSWLHELGPHIVDLAWWAMDPGAPVAVSASGGKFVADDISDIPDTMDVHWEFPNFNMSWIHTSYNSYPFGFGDKSDRGRKLGVLFHGVKGTLLANYDSHWISSEGDALKEIPEVAKSIPSSPGHDREFLDAIKTRQNPSCSFEYHVPLAIALNLGHIALNTGKKIHWDAKAGKVIGEPDSLVKPVYRKPWVLPA